VADLSFGEKQHPISVDIAWGWREANNDQDGYLSEVSWDGEMLMNYDDDDVGYAEGLDPAAEDSVVGLPGDCSDILTTEVRARLERCYPASPPFQGRKSVFKITNRKETGNFSQG